MRTRLGRPVFGGLVGISAAWFALTPGCSSDNGANAGPDDASLTCPASIAATIDFACPHDGQDCPIGYACGDFAEQAHCVCTKGKFECTDATGNVIAKGAEPKCLGLPPPNPNECPASESSTEGKTCRTSGLICYYTGVKCPENATAFVDHCQCVGSASSDSGLAFRCEPQTCNPRSDASDDAFSPPDTGPTDAGKDG